MDLNDLKEKFVKIQESGQYNMFMDAKIVASILGISVDEYFNLLDKI